MDELSYLQIMYKENMMKLLNNESLSIIEREFYAESPNWYTNQNQKSMVDTLIWSTYTDIEKKDILDKELEDYFKQ